MDTPNKADVVLDLKGLSCPAPLVGAKRLFDDLSEGQVLLLISDCPGTQDDLFAWARQTGNEVLATVKNPEGGQGYYVRKGKSILPKANAMLDMRGTTCPGPIVEARKMLSAMATGEVLELISNCPGVKDDIVSWAHSTGIKLMHTAELGGGDFAFYMARG